MWTSRLLSPESKVFTGTAIGNSQPLAWQAPLPRAAWLTASHPLAVRRGRRYRENETHPQFRAHNQNLIDTEATASP
jgi:hypothetical protein